VASGSDKGRKLQEIMSTGGLVSNDEVLSLLNDAIVRSKGSSKGFLIDGYPREKNQGVEFETRVAPADLALYFDCSEDTMVQRILARAAASSVKREDDNEKTIRARLQTFRQNTNAILELYDAKTLTVSNALYISKKSPRFNYRLFLIQINAERDVDDIFLEVVQAIDCVLKKKQQKAAAQC